VWVIHESGLKVGWDDSLYIWKQAPFDDVFYLVVSCTDCFLYVRILSFFLRGQEMMVQSQLASIAPLDVVCKHLGRIIKSVF